MLKNSFIVLMIIFIIQSVACVMLKVENNSLLADNLKIEALRSIERASFEEVLQKQRDKEMSFKEKKAQVIIKYTPIKVASSDGCEKKLKLINDSLAIFYAR